MADYDRDLTVFLTISLAGIRGNADAALLDTLGPRFRKVKIPIAIGRRIREAGRAACIDSAHDFGLEVLNCREFSTIGGRCAIAT